MVMRAMGEVLLTRLDYRSFADFVGDYLGPQASFYLGWTYWLSWVVTCIADVVVCGSYMQYWFSQMSAWMPALSTLGILYLVPNVMTLFTIVSTLAAIMVVFSWGMILVAYLVYRYKRPDLHEQSTFKMPAGVVMSGICLLFFAFSFFMMIFDPDTLKALMATPLWFVVLWLFWTLKRKREGRIQLGLI